MACHSRGDYGNAFPSDIPQPTKLQCSDSFTEWRSREQLEPSQPSTSPAYWDSDNDDNCDSSSIVGPKPSDLYGKFTWKIESFSEISKRELRSNVFEVGGYKWYILVYPQGCDVCNHLSLFLCVADYDKLLPGWSHFAQFTIAVVNKDPKKSKYSDTLHRFCKKEHDWGWKKFMELSKVLDGFTVADTLVIKAQVQVIRENPHRPFRCLDCQYRRELVRVYLTNVEGICRRFVEEKREKLGKLMEDTPRWASFRTFWSAVENGARYNLAREKMDVILKAVVKRFFNEKEVTSTLVMDALYSGCKSLDYWSKSKKGKINGVEMEDAVNPVIWVDKDAFVLAGDVLVLLERAVTESLPSYKDEKGPQNRTKDVGSGDDLGKDTVERDERRLTELGRRTVEMFVLAHLYTNRVEVAYREAIALKRQEELIREEEAAGQAETEMRTKREAAEKEKRSKKKQAKQRRKDRKEKDKEAEEKKVQVEHRQHQCQDLSNNACFSKKLLPNECKLLPLLSTEADEDDLSGLEPIDNVVVGILGPAAEDADIDRSGWEMEGSYVQNSTEPSISGALLQEATRKMQTTLDDSSSTCSSDSLPSVCTTVNESLLARPILPEQSHLLPRSERNQMDSEIDDTDGQFIEAEGMLRVMGFDANGTGEPSSSCSSVGVDAEAVILSLKDRVQWLEQRLFEKEEEVVILQEQLSLLQHQMGIDQSARLLVQEPLRLSYSGQCCGEVAEEGKGEASPSLIPPHGGEGIDPEKSIRCVVATPGSGRTNRHQLLSNGNGALSRIPCLSEMQGCESRNNDNLSGLAKLDLIRTSIAPSRSKSVDSSRPPRVLMPIPGSAMAGSGSFSAGEDISLVYPILASPSGIDVSISRPSSAPVLVTGIRPNIPLSSVSVHPSQPLARSMSVGAGRSVSGTEPGVGAHMKDLSGHSPTTPSYKNATIGKTRSSSWTGTAVNSSHIHPSSSGGVSRPVSGATAQCSMSLTNISQVIVPFSASVPLSPPLTPPQTRVLPGQVSLLLANGRNDEVSLPVPPVVSMGLGSLPLSSGVETAVSQIMLENDGGGGCMGAHPSVGITFGTVTPELLKDDQLELLPLQDQFQSEEQVDCEHSQDPHLQPASNVVRHTTVKHQLLHQYHVQGLSVEMDIGPGKSGIMQTGAGGSALENINNGAVMSEEFPYLDIINDLLDEDQNQGMAQKNSQHQGSSAYNRSVLMARNTLNYGQLSSDRTVSGSGCDGERSRIVKNDDERASNNALRMNSPFQHPSLAHLHCKNSLDRVSSHYWPIGSSAVPSVNSSTNVHNGLVDSHLAYSLVQGHHLAVPDCSGFTLGHTGYTVYTPAQQP